MISTNYRYLALAIENLLDNANKFTQNGNIKHGYEVNQKRKQIQISVTDTECGIPIKKQEKVFKRFMKLDTFQSRNGLRLYLFRIIIKRLSGKIRIDPEYTGGNRMLINLPI